MAGFCCQEELGPDGEGGDELVDVALEPALRLAAELNLYAYDDSIPGQSCGLFIHVAASRDCDNKHGHFTILDRVDHATVTNAISIRADETAFQRFDVIPEAGVFLERSKHRASFFATALSHRW